MGFRLVKRVFRGDKCVGYYMNGNGRIEPVGIDIVHKYAVNKMIDNVSVKNVNGSIVLFGINGFRIEDLPVERLKEKSNADLRVLEIHKIDGRITEYVIESTAKVRAAVKPEMVQNYLNAGRLDKESLKTAKVVERSTENLVSIYNKHKEEIYSLVKKYLSVIDALETGDISEKDKIVGKIREIEAVAAQNKMDKETFINTLEQCKRALMSGIQNKIEIYRKNTFNNIRVDLNKLSINIKKLDRNNSLKVVQDVRVLQQKIDELKNIQDFDTYRKLYNEVNKSLVSLNNRVADTLNKQNKENQELDRKLDLIKQEISKIPENDELREQKIKIMYEPWCLSNKTFLSSNQYLTNCYLTSKNGDNTQSALSLKNLTIKETFNNNNQRTGFDVVYRNNGRKYHFRQKLNNMSLLAAFIKVAEDENLLKDNCVNIKVQSRGESRSIKLGVS